MGICYIIASMKTEYRIKRRPGDFVIAADGGYGQKLGCDPDVVIGDFDSLGYVPEAENVQVYPKQKDDTDMMLAVKLGLEKGYREFVLLGGIGGRFDHMMANVQTLAYLHAHGAKGVLRSEIRDLYLIGAGAQGGRITFSPQVKGILSVFSYGEKAEQVTICGAEYEIENSTLTDTFPLGVSNSFIGREVTVSVGRGRLLIVHEKSSV
ncbi:MAG: thiamine diphosphokinase [Lachnospiraceae bacterium]|nr:thiamine diphosphokinase [Lachnospiraceae bacterium]